jgi:hypothetical protein
MSSRRASSERKRAESKSKGVRGEMKEGEAEVSTSGREQAKMKRMGHSIREVYLTIGRWKSVEEIPGATRGTLC